MNVKIRALHEPDAELLDLVVAQMRELGPPTIEVVDCGDYYAALEGSHRLAAAARLGLSPRLVVRAADEMLDASAYDWFDEVFFPDADYRAGDLVRRLHWRPASLYEFREDGD